MRQHEGDASGLAITGLERFSAQSMPGDASRAKKSCGAIEALGTFRTNASNT
jgi:hypothetical protein